ncbi:hypothetical protein PIB30_008578 [Stylosanthes scabra]|uniref:Uncharacterized protein n=1 Tax=Stylosanthes scabra TaxID=79078 RepID=A0ABU6Q508_9FABA|nr:hypothetical protein [Stylosanthes scabra]
MEKQCGRITVGAKQLYLYGPRVRDGASNLSSHYLLLEGRQKVTKEVKKLGIEVVNDNGDGLEKLQAKNDAPKGVQVKKIEKMKSRNAYVSNVDFETGGYEDGEDLMAILKE